MKYNYCILQSAMFLLVLFAWGLQPSFGSPPSLCNSTMHFSGPLAQQKRSFINALLFDRKIVKPPYFPEQLSFPETTESLLREIGLEIERKPEYVSVRLNSDTDSFTFLNRVYTRLTQLESQLHLSPLRFVFRGKTPQGKTVLWNPFPDESLGEWINFNHGGDIAAPQEISFGEKENQASDYYLNTEHFMRLFARGIVIISHDKLLTHDLFGHVIPRILYPKQGSYYQGMLFRFFNTQGDVPLTNEQNQGLFYLDEINSFSINPEIKPELDSLIDHLCPEIAGQTSRKKIFQFLNHRKGSYSFPSDLKILAKKLSASLPKLFHYFGGFLNDGLNTDHVFDSDSAHYLKSSSLPHYSPRYVNQLLTPLGSVREFIRLVNPQHSRKIAAELVPLALFHLSLFLSAYNQEISLNDNLINGLYSVLYRSEDPYFKNLYEHSESDFVQAAPPYLKVILRETLQESKSPEKVFP